VVERVSDPEDARARRVRFTARGRAGLLDGLAILKSLEEECAKVIGARRMAEMRRALVALNDHLTDK
jgi:DNA-binding MarR family transcriptional regulator